MTEPALGAAVPRQLRPKGVDVPPPAVRRPVRPIVVVLAHIGAHSHGPVRQNEPTLRFHSLSKPFELARARLFGHFL